MKIRLHITVPSGDATTVERSGPTVHIGRNPECEVHVNDAKVSWRHARIDLAAGGAILCDLGASNRTLHNDLPIERPMPLHVGDRIQLGHTGATLTVLALDLSAPPPRSLLPWPFPPKGVALAAASAGLLLVGVLVVLASRRPAPQSQPAQTPPPPQETSPQAATAERSERLLTSPDPTVTAEELFTQVTTVGHYVAPPANALPSILLQRQGEAYPWVPLRADDPVSTAHTLVSLPGYRSVVALDSGVQLTLGGNLPVFSASPGVLESAVMLHVPSPGTDLDLTVARGQIVVANRKPAGPAQVRLRFLWESWDVTLPEPGRAITVEPWPAPPLPGNRAAPSEAATQLFVLPQGLITLRTPQAAFPLADRSPAVLRPNRGTTSRPDPLGELPAWWGQPPNLGDTNVADAVLALKDWHQALARPAGDVVDTLLTRVREEKGDVTLRVLGVLHLAALGETRYLVSYLEEERRHSQVRGAALYALHFWLGRNPAHEAELVRLFQDRLGYSPEKAARALRLLRGFPLTALRQAETYQGLIHDLDHDNLAVRQLAFWQLSMLAPKGATEIHYDPLADTSQRRQSIERWRAILPAGTVPVRLD
ncbi:MAG: FHA domain-containing protein [Gemmataceae bacterium]|nr:FHA domain-containing protein [Gemmataceae bacterium]